MVTTQISSSGRCTSTDAEGTTSIRRPPYLQNARWRGGDFQQICASRLVGDAVTRHAFLTGLMTTAMRNRYRTAIDLKKWIDCSRLCTKPVFIGCGSGIAQATSSRDREGEPGRTR